MPTTILLIENDAVFAREITEALEATGYQVRLTGDGKEGLDLAKEAAPAAIVLCVELPKMSGYSICQKLKKDDALKGIPLLLTSAEATAEKFGIGRAAQTRIIRQDTGKVTSRNRPLVRELTGVHRRERVVNGRPEFDHRAFPDGQRGNRASRDRFTSLGWRRQVS